MRRRAIHSPSLSAAARLSPGGPSPCRPHYRVSFGYYAASALLATRWHFRVCWPGWHPGADTVVQEFSSSVIPDDRTLSCLPHAGWYWRQHVCSSEGKRPPPYLLVQVIQPLHLFWVTTLTQVSLVSIGSGFDTQPLSAGSWCSLSAGFPPDPLPGDNAGCSTLTPLSCRNSFWSNLL
jgi:hypothetical protein